jgi:hypothetical protein
VRASSALFSQISVEVIFAYHWSRSERGELANHASRFWSSREPLEVSIE